MQRVALSTYTVLAGVNQFGKRREGYVQAEKERKKEDGSKESIPLPGTAG